MVWKFHYGCKRSRLLSGQENHTLFAKFALDGKIAILIVYVDDIIVTGDYAKEIKHLNEALAKEFEIKDLSPLRYFLGMEVTRSSKGICCLKGNILLIYSLKLVC